MSKSLKQMAYDTIEAHQETIADLRTQLAKANERVKELEQEKNKYFESLCMHAQRIPESDWSHNKDAVALLNKFAIEKKIEVLTELLDENKNDGFSDSVARQFFERKIEQLRKEQE